MLTRATQTLNRALGMPASMRTRALVMLLLTLAALAGCIGPDEDPLEAGADAQDPDQATQDPREEETPPEPVEEIQAPQWEVGDWWSYEVEHALGPSVEVTLVVTEVTRGAYTLSWADVDEALATLTYHFPPVGEIDRPDLGWWVHGETGRILSFPIEDQAAWGASFAGEPYAFEATFAGPDEAPVVELTGEAEEGEGTIEATYDPSVGFFERFARLFEQGGPPSPSAVLVDNGALEDAPGAAYTPTPEDLLNEVVVGPSAEQARPPVGDPVGSFSVGDGVDRLVLAGFSGGQEGHYSWSVNAPSGTTFGGQTTNMPGDGSMAFTHYGLEDPEAGSWTYEISPVGPGLVILEAMGVSLEEASLAAGEG